MSSLLYSSEAMEDLSNKQKNIIQITTSIEYLTPSASSINGIEHMFSKIVFYPDGEEPIEFQSHECVRIAHCLIEGTRAQKKELIKPLEEHYPKIPCYSSYNDQIENEFQKFTNHLLSQAAKFYEVDAEGLRFIIELFYKFGPHFLLYNPNVTELWSNIMTSISKKKDDASCFVEEDYDKHILPAQVNPSQYSVSGWLGLTRYIRKTNEPISGWWVSIGNRLILLRNLPDQRQHFYVSDHGSQEEILRFTKEKFLTFSDEGRKELFHALSFWMLFYQKLPKEKEELLMKRFLLLLHQGHGGNEQKDEFLLYVLSLPINLCSRAISDGRLDYPCSNVGHYIGIRSEGDLWAEIPLSEEEVENLENIPINKQEDYIHVYKKTLEHISYKGKQSQIYFDNLFTRNQPGGGLSPFFTQIKNIFSPADTERYQMFFILKEMSKGLASGLQEFLYRPLCCFGSREEGESYRGFANAFDQYAKSQTARPSHELAQEMRALLKGGVLKDESLYFLPNLIAAWFVSETARNEGSILSSLMLLDLIESGISLIDAEGCNRYDWKFTLIHPKKPKYNSMKVIIKDLYGDDIELADFDGIHPMAHHGSISGGKTLLTNKTNLSAVQQKEGHLIIHWLSQKLKKKDPTLNAQPQLISTAGVLSKNPDYTEIDRLLEAIDKPSSRMPPQLKRKWQYLQVIKRSLMERLSTLDNLLGMEGGTEQAPFILDKVGSQTSFDEALSNNINSTMEPVTIYWFLKQIFPLDSYDIIKGVFCFITFKRFRKTPSCCLTL